MVGNAVLSTGSTMSSEPPKTGDVEPPPDSSSPSQHDLRRQWIVAFVIGELVGFIPPAVVGAGLAAAGGPDGVVVPSLTAAGSLEGAALGTAQAVVLRRHLPRFRTAGWIIATAMAAAFAWMVGMSIGSLLGNLQDPPGWLFPALAVAALAALLGMGFGQWLVIRPVVPNSSRWIPVTAGAWLIGVAIPVVAISLVPNEWPAAGHATIGVVAAVAMGVVVGAITGATMQRLVARARRVRGGAAA